MTLFPMMSRFMVIPKQKSVKVVPLRKNATVATMLPG